MTTFLLTELPPLDDMSCAKAVAVAPLISISANNKDQRNVVVPHFKNNLPNTLTSRNKVATALNAFKQFRTDLQNAEQTELSIQAGLTDIKKLIDRISYDLSDARNKSDLCQIRIEPAIPMKANSKFQDISKEIDLLTKRIESKEDKFYKNERQIYAKLHQLQSLINQLDQPSDFKSTDYSNLLLRIEQIDSFIQEHQYILLDKFLKTKPTEVKIPDSLTNFQTAISESIKEHQVNCDLKISQESSRINNRIQLLFDSIQTHHSKLPQSSDSLISVQEKNENINMELNQLQYDSETLQNQLNERLLNIETTMNSFLESIGDPLSEISNLNYDSNLFKPIYDDRLNIVKQLSKDWELFHRNNVTVQREVFDHIGQFDQDVSLNIPILDRIEAAERMANYCVQRVKQWKLEEDQKIAMSVDEKTLIEKLKEMEAKVAIAEERLEKHDKKSPKTPPFSIESTTEMTYSLPPKIAVIGEENDNLIKPIVLDSKLILTYNQEQMNQEITLPEAPHVQCIAVAEEKSSSFTPLKLPKRVETEQPNPKIELNLTFATPKAPVNVALVTPTVDQQSDLSPFLPTAPPTTPILKEKIDQEFTPTINNTPTKEIKDDIIQPIPSPVISNVQSSTPSNHDEQVLENTEEPIKVEILNKEEPIIAEEEKKEEAIVVTKEAQIEPNKETDDKKGIVGPPATNIIQSTNPAIPQAASKQPQVIAQSTPTKSLDAPQSEQATDATNTNQIVTQLNQDNTEDKPSAEKPTEKEKPSEDASTPEEEKLPEDETLAEEEKPPEEANTQKEEKLPEEEKPTEKEKPAEEERTLEEEKLPDKEKPLVRSRSVDNDSSSETKSLMTDSSFEDSSSYYTSPSSLGRIKIMHKKRRHTNRCYDPFTPSKKGDPLKFV